eukprot:CAMPEP_0177651112 /NCGR_PEP_ID=MMETSP0447-20121125/12343_1 /TAXON_ID=0 /ORGANISM="Stygamoeba regulata, Strain BSH-02190019" /LENGTH=36 /DNA_ID= /DNA_START= /DNA_END= /DNA_ORIENTATION=
MQAHTDAPALARTPAHSFPPLFSRILLHRKMSAPPP